VTNASPVERDSTLAMGGTRWLPAPDPIAHDYLRLALRLDQHTPGLVDGFFGPADLKAQVDMEQLRAPARLRDDAAALRERVRNEVAETDRADWLDAQLRALEAQAAALAGDAAPYAEHLTACFGCPPKRRSDAIFERAAAEIDALLPGSGSLDQRLAAHDEAFEIDVDRLPAVVDWLVARFRERAAALFGLPPGDQLAVALVRGRPWTGYNWYEGGLRSRVELNTDLPLRATDLVNVVAHETYPGHHLEHAWKEAELVGRLGRLESSVLLINTPECLVSEGLADLGAEFVSPWAERAALLVELFDRASLPLACDRAAARDAADLVVALAGPRRRLQESRVNAALMRHADGAPRDEVLDYLQRVGRFAPAIAEKRLEFIEHPLWRTYVFVYHEGEALLRRWLGATPDDARAGRFRRLLTEQLTPRAIAAETGVPAPTSTPSTTG
jgi:hypothetical protein